MNADTENRLFGPVERRLFRFTAVVFSSVVLVGLVGVIVWILGKTLAVFYHLVLPLSVAGILALVRFRPPVSVLYALIRRTAAWHRYSMYATAQTASGFKFILNLS